MKKLLITLFILSTLSYGKVITEESKEEYVQDKVYDFSNVKSDKYLIIKSVNNNLYFINKEHITNIAIMKKYNNAIYIEFFGESRYVSIKKVEVHKDSYDTILEYLKGNNNVE